MLRLATDPFWWWRWCALTHIINRSIYYQCDQGKKINKYMNAHLHIKLTRRSHILISSWARGFFFCVNRRWWLYCSIGVIKLIQSNTLVWLRGGCERGYYTNNNTIVWPIKTNINRIMQLLLSNKWVSFCLDNVLQFGLNPYLLAG